MLRVGRAGLSAYARRFIAWFGPRGLNSLLFAPLVVAQGIPGGEERAGTVAELFTQSPDDVLRFKAA